MSYANYFDMDQQLETANDPLASWQPHAPSVQGDRYAEFGGHADPPEPHRDTLYPPGFDDSPKEPQYAIVSTDKPNYVCLHRDCELGFDDDLALDRHMTAHFDQSKLPTAGTAADQPGTGERGPTQPLLASDRIPYFYGNAKDECPVRDCAFRHYWYKLLEKHRKTHFLRGDKYMCQFEGCGCGFKRWGDLVRHEKSHLPDAPKHDCPEIGCDYKGRKGFARHDKLMDHRRNQHGHPAAPRANRGRRRAAQNSSTLSSSATVAPVATSSTAETT